MVERRSILQGLVALVAAPAIVRVASLMPCAPTEVIRFRSPWMTLDMITREGVRLFCNTNAFMKSLDEQYRAADYAEAHCKIGSTLRIRLPNEYTVTDVPPPPAVDALVVATVAVVAVPKLLDKPVTRRFWSSPQHSAAD